MATISQELEKINMNFKNFIKSFTKSYSYLWCFALFLAIFMTPADALSRKEKQAFDSSIIVLAPTSMTNALDEVLRVYSSMNNISVSGIYESSSELATLIEDGEPANIFISDDKAKITDLQRLGMLNVYSFANVVSDTLVVAVPKDNFLKKKLEEIEDTAEKLTFIAENVSLVIPDPDLDPAGNAIKQAFEKIGSWDDVSGKMLKAANTRNALYLIANGNNAGVVYYSDVASDESVEVLLEIPQDYYDKITYQASIVAEFDSEESKKDSEKFLNFLKTDTTRKIFTKYGFRDI